MVNSPHQCGNCTLCCKVLGVKELAKPKYEWCTHCDKTNGCRIYNTRPDECRDFSCSWLTAPDTLMGEALKPNKCKIVFGPTADEKRLVAYVDPSFPTAWEHEPARSFINRMVELGLDVIITCGDFRKLISNDPEAGLIELVEHDANDPQP